MASRTGTAHRRSLMVGWLYADLLLVLLLAALGSYAVAGGAAEAVREEAPQPAPVPLPVPTPDPEVVPAPETGLRKEPVSISVVVDTAMLRAGDPATLEGFRRDLNARLTEAIPDIGAERAGLSITFGQFPGDVGTAMRTGEAANAQALLANPSFFGGAVLKGYGNGAGSADRNVVTFEIYVVK